MATVTYTGPAQFLTSQTWRQIQPSLFAQSPLRNLHWKSASRPSIHTIQQLDLSFVLWDSVRDEHASQVPTTLLDKPLLHIYVFLCEESDLETYRSTYKKQIKDWHSSVSTRKNQEWLILQIIRSEIRVQSGKLFQLKGSVSDKLKSDFNSDKRDRCVLLNWSTGSDNPATWVDFTNKFKDGILLAFDSAVSQREEEVRRSESQSSMPGWNFCTFFILKESLATSFSVVGLLEDALQQYDELEVSFFQVMKDKNMSWFGVLIDATPQDASAPLLSIAKKPYRDLILANNISIFDFRIYLLARQCEILANLGRINEVCRKSAAFLGAFGRRLREVERTLPAFFIEYWKYSSALSVVDQCDAWTPRIIANKVDSPSTDAGKGELLELARNQLDVIGVTLGHLPAQPPFSEIENRENGANVTSSAEATSQLDNASFAESITDRERFYGLYSDTTNRAIEFYAKGGRKKFALKLHASLAVLDCHRGNLSAALSTFSSLPAHYQLHAWTSLESFMYSKALETHESMEKDRDREWLTMILSYLKTYADTAELDSSLAHGGNSQLSQLITTVKNSADQLDSDLIYPDHPAVSIQVAREAHVSDSQDGSFLDVTVYNHLACELPIEEIHIILVGRDSERLRYSSSSSSLPPGKSAHRLFCPVPLSGSYILEASEIRMSRILLQWPHWKPNSGSKSRKSSKGKPVLVHVPRDPLAFDVQVNPPVNVELGQARNVVVRISSGRNSISEASLRLSSSSVEFYHQQITPLYDAPPSVDSNVDLIIIKDLPAYTDVSFSVGHSDSSQNTINVGLEVTYKTTVQSEVPRKFRVSRNVSVSLPLSLFVEDFFCGEQLFSKFTISTTSHQHIRILAAELRPPTNTDVQIISCSTEGRVIPVTPSQPANLLFLIQSTVGPLRESLQLHITFRLLREEIEDRVETAVNQVLADSQHARRRTSLIRQLISALEKESSWVALYTHTGQLHITMPQGDTGLEPDLDEIQQILARPPSSPAAGPWRHIVLPVDVPSMNIVASVSIKLERTPFSKMRASQEGMPPLYAGEPISALMSIHTSFHWGERNDKDQAFRLRFDLQEMVHDWLVSGWKRGDVSVKHDETIDIPITLVALHHGMLSLPQVEIMPLPVIGGEMTMGSIAIPNTFAYQLHGAEKVLILPRSSRTTFLVDIGD